MIQYQILQTKITRTIWQTVRRITNEIMGVKGLMKLKQILKRRQISEKLFKKQFLLCLSVNGIFSHFSGENETSIANNAFPLELTVPLKEILSKKKKHLEFLSDSQCISSAKFIRQTPTGLVLLETT